jgi:1-pyrroline-5-carboxylate dehydrogenase
MTSVKNLAPKFSQWSKIPSNIKDIMYNTLENPVYIPNNMMNNYFSNNHLYTNNYKQISAFNKNKHIAKYDYINEHQIHDYFDTFKSQKEIWADTPFNHKREVFLNAANLIETKYYDKMLAYTILGQNKTIYEAELDAICELVDFLRFNVYYTELIFSKQPKQTSFHNNISTYNPLNGFVASITPFNFTAIGANLASAPLLFGNSVLWKPSNNSILSNHLFYEIMLEAGLPHGVLNFCPMEPDLFLNNIINNSELSAILFTGSSQVLDNIYKNIGTNIESFKNYPRIIGESGGKNFHFVDNSPFSHDNMEFIVRSTIESAFNYSGQKCSACSIIYIPDNLLDDYICQFKIELKKYMENTENYGVINDISYNRLNNLLNNFKNDSEIEFVTSDIQFVTSDNNSNSYHINPNILLCNNHEHDVFNKEFFGPILSIYPYKETHIKDTLDKCCTSNNYALTGSIFGNSEFMMYATNKLKYKTGNFYINDKSTGSVVGQQPFGGSGKSGTNDKAGDINLLYRLFNQRNIKNNFKFN